MYDFMKLDNYLFLRIHGHLWVFFVTGFFFQKIATFVKISERSTLRGLTSKYIPKMEEMLKFTVP